MFRPALGGVAKAGKHSLYGNLRTFLLLDNLGRGPLKFANFFTRCLLLLSAVNAVMHVSSALFRLCVVMLQPTTMTARRWVQLISNGAFAAESMRILVCDSLCTDGVISDPGRANIQTYIVIIAYSLETKYASKR